MRIFLLLSAILFGFGNGSIAIAEDAPVVAATPAPAGSDGSATDTQIDSSQASNMSEPAPAAAPPASQLTLEQRVSVLERQLSASNQIGLMNQVNELQNQLQELQGQVEQLSHTVQTLQSQSSSQYADLDQRLSRLGSGASPKAGINVSQSSASSGHDVKKPDNSAEQTAYESAYDKVKNGNYNDAIVSLKNFIQQYPNGTYVSNAHYWLGQMLLLKGDGKSAEKEFQFVIAHYPDNPKVKDAQLKLGFAYLLQNKNAQAKLQFKKVIEKYPDTSTAKLAKARLAEMA